MRQVEFRQEAESFLDSLIGELDRGNLNVDRYDIDHLCYRTESAEAYSQVTRDISSFAELLVESPVNGRMIATYRLHEPLMIRSRTIDVVEVPAPKVGKATARGFEHVEIVIDEPFETFAARDPSRKWKVSAKDLNPELQTSFNTGAVKFHHLALENVIWIERTAAALDAFEEVSRALAPLKVLFSGSVPLGLATTESDFDFIVEAGDGAAVEAAFSRKPGFEIHSRGAALIANYVNAGRRIQIYLQPQPVYEQRAHRHLLIEARLLKLNRQKYFEILSYKLEGIKTEPAFAAAFGIQGDPYIELERLSWASEAELREALGLRHQTA